MPTGVYAFSRDLGDDHVCVVVNRSPYEHTERLEFGPADRNVALIDWLDRRDARFPAFRPPSRMAGRRLRRSPAPGQARLRGMAW